MNIKNALRKGLYWCGYMQNVMQLAIHRVQLGEKCKFRGKLYIKTAHRKEKGHIAIGDHVCINSSMRSDPIGGDTRTILYTRKNGKIIIDDNVGISNTTIVAESAVSIGAYTNIGGGTKIYDTDFHSIDPKDRLAGDTCVKSSPIHIGERVFIGGHCLILKGVTIGDDSVIGAGSVVTKDIPPNEIWAGNPAKYIKKVNGDN